MYDMAEIARKNGKNVKDNETKIASTLYHEPDSNLIVVSMVNEGDKAYVNMNLDNSKEQHNYKIINPKVGDDEEWTRGKDLAKNSMETWIIAPKVPFAPNYLHTWEIKDAILGDSKECAMM